MRDAGRARVSKDRAAAQHEERRVSNPHGEERRAAPRLEPWGSPPFRPSPCYVRAQAAAVPRDPFMALRLFRLASCAFACLVVTGSDAMAHPHVWVTMKSEVVYGADGAVTGVRHAWTFDDMFSAFATQGLESKKKGEFTREELKPLAEVNVTSLKDFDYFTSAKVDGKK